MTLVWGDNNINNNTNNNNNNNGNNTGNKHFAGWLQKIRVRQVRAEPAQTGLNQEDGETRHGPRN